MTDNINWKQKTDNRTNVDTGYTYDKIYQLLTAMQGATTESYTDDQVGNRLTALSPTGNWAYDNANELNSRPNVSYTYDSNGNTLTKTDATGQATYAWDFENRLTQVTLPGTQGTATFKYDPFGRRAQKVFTANAGCPT